MSHRRFKVFAKHNPDDRNCDLYAAEAIPDGPDDRRFPMFLVDSKMLPEETGDAFAAGQVYEMEIRAVGPITTEEDAGLESVGLCHWSHIPQERST